MEKTTDTLIKEATLIILKWAKLNCTTRTTSRNNIYNNYWQLKSTGVLYTDEELFEYWDINVNKK